jgi:hypothetical protein
MPGPGSNENSAKRPFTIVLYQGNDKRVAGHIAIADLPCGKENSRFNVFNEAAFKWKGYLSYESVKAEVPILVKDDWEHYFSPESDEKIYGKAIKITFPAVDEDLLLAAMKKFSELDKSQYSLLKNNCATNVLAFIKQIDPSVTADFITPKDVALLACNIQARDLERRRVEGLQSFDTDSGFSLGLQELIKIEIELARNKAIQTEISSTTMMSNIGKKILSTSTLLSLFAGTENPDSIVKQRQVAMLENLHQQIQSSPSDAETFKLIHEFPRNNAVDPDIQRHLETYADRMIRNARVITEIPDNLPENNSPQEPTLSKRNSF